MKWVSAYTRIVWLLLTLATIYYVSRQGGAALDKFERVGKLAESNGGKILMLAIVSMLFFLAAMGFAYYVMDGIQAGTLKADDVMANMTVQFVTGAFGAVIGALITMLGGSGKGNSPDGK